MHLTISPILVLSSIEFIPQIIQYGLENMFNEEPGTAQLWRFATLLDKKFWRFPTVSEP